jgi:prevent-host-death family protein
MTANPQELSAAEFKAKCLKLMDTVQQNRTEIIITKRGKPIAKLIPFTEEPPAVFGFMADTVTILGDVVSPLEMMWQAEHE